MKVRVWIGDPYKVPRLSAAYVRGSRDRRTDGTWRRSFGDSARIGVAYDAGFRNRSWHRSPNGQLKWHRVGA